MSQDRPQTITPFCPGGFPHSIPPQRRSVALFTQVFHHAILNLPDSALTFLDTFRGVHWREHGFDSPPMVHVYCFSKAADPKQARKCFLLSCYYAAEPLGRLCV